MQRMTRKAVAQPYVAETYPGYAAPIIRAGNGADFRVDLAVFGLIPAWSKDRSIGKRTYNARTETVAEKPSYRNAWRQQRYCLVPMERFFEPCWETGKAVRWSIHRRDKAPFAVAAIWDRWTDRSSGEIVESFSMLTINADGHAVMGRFHRPGDERRSLVVVPHKQWQAWLTAEPSVADAMMLPMDASFDAASSEPVQAAAPSLF
jgi:putative SOS response-associated peptidase YedK